MLLSLNFKKIWMHHEAFDRSLQKAHEPPEAVVGRSLLMGSGKISKTCGLTRKFAEIIGLSPTVLFRHATTTCMHVRIDRYD